MVKKITLSICASLCIITPLSAQTKPFRLGHVKKMACGMAKKTAPTAGALLISIPMLLFAHNYLGFTYTVDLKTDQPDWIKKTKKA